jgi:hypothetical protein
MRAAVFSLINSPTEHGRIARSGGWDDPETMRERLVMTRVLAQMKIPQNQAQFCTVGNYM